VTESVAHSLVNQILEGSTDRTLSILMWRAQKAVLGPYTDMLLVVGQPLGNQVIENSRTPVT
jgi:hypothetical protein